MTVVLGAAVWKWPGFETIFFFAFPVEHLHNEAQGELVYLWLLIGRELAWKEGRCSTRSCRSWWWTTDSTGIYIFDEFIRINSTCFLCQTCTTTMFAIKSNLYLYLYWKSRFESRLHGHHKLRFWLAARYILKRSIGTEELRKSIESSGLHRGVSDLLCALVHTMRWIAFRILPVAVLVDSWLNVCYSARILRISILR